MGSIFHAADRPVFSRTALSSCVSTPWVAFSVQREIRAPTRQTIALPRTIRQIILFGNLPKGSQNNKYQSNDSTEQEHIAHRVNLSGADKPFTRKGEHENRPYQERYQNEPVRCFFRHQKTLTTSCHSFDSPGDPDDPKAEPPHGSRSRGSSSHDHRCQTDGETRISSQEIPCRSNTLP